MGELVSVTMQPSVDLLMKQGLLDDMANIKYQFRIRLLKWEQATLHQPWMPYLVRSVDRYAEAAIWYEFDSSISPKVL